MTKKPAYPILSHILHRTPASPSQEKEEWVEQLEEASAFDYYRVFQPPNFVQEVVYQSKLYAVQKNKKMSLDTMNEDTYRYLPTL